MLPTLSLTPVRAKLARNKRSLCRASSEPPFSQGNNALTVLGLLCTFFPATRCSRTRTRGSVGGDASGGAEPGRTLHAAVNAQKLSMTTSEGREIRVTCTELLCRRELRPAFVSVIRHPRIPVDLLQLLASRMSAAAWKILFHRSCPVPDENSLKAAASTTLCYCRGTRLSVASHYCRHRVICTKAQDQNKWFQNS